MSSAQAKKGGKSRYFKKKAAGPPKGGDGQGDFKGSAMTQYRSQPLPEMLTSPGIIVTTVQHKEMIAEREIIDALEVAADEVYPGTGGGADEEDGEDGDIEDMLKKELEGLAAGKTAKSPRFRVCKRDTVCVLYINVLPPLDPIVLVRHIIEKCERTARCSFRFTQRLTPVTAISHASLDNLRKIAAETLPEKFAGGPKKFAIQTATRNSNALERLEMIKTVAAEVANLSPEHKVDLAKPDRTIMIELFKTAMGISVVEDFEKYKKFNPAAVAREAAKTVGKEATDSRVGITDEEEKVRSTGQARSENRVRRMEGIKAAQEEAEEAKSRPQKRKAEAEEGQVALRPEDVEMGEAVEDESTELGDEFVEEIQGGRAVKVRREE